MPTFWLATAASERMSPSRTRLFTDAVEAVESSSCFASAKNNNKYKIRLKMGFRRGGQVFRLLFRQKNFGTEIGCRWECWPFSLCFWKKKKKICCRPSWSTRPSSLVKMIIKYELDQRKKNNKRKISSSQIHYFRGCECGVWTGDLFWGCFREIKYFFLHEIQF